MFELFEYQKNHVNNLIKSLNTYKRALDTSDTGTGKTYTTISICKNNNYIPFVICPKIVINNWVKLFKEANIIKYKIINYESLQRLVYLDENNNLCKCDFITKKITKISEDKEIIEYTWINDKIENNLLLIFDEVHKCKNSNTNNGKILKSASEIKKVNILLLSATVVDKPKYFILVGYVLGLFDKILLGKRWLKNISINYLNEMEGINKIIYPNHASRMKLKDIGKIINIEKINNIEIDELNTGIIKNNIFARCENMDNSELIQKEYEIINEAIIELKKNQKNANQLTKILYCRQQIELFKIPTFIKLTKKYINENKSVVIFVNFTKTLQHLSKELDTLCVSHGTLDIKIKNKNIQNFMDDKERIIICNIQCSSVGINLHDIHGNYPRISIISPTWSSLDLLQIFGRIYRANVKTNVEQYILFCSNTVEEKMSENIKAKIKNIALLNDGDCSSYKIDGFVYETIDCTKVNNSKTIIMNKKKQYNNNNNNNNNIHQKNVIIETKREILNNINQNISNNIAIKNIAIKNKSQNSNLESKSSISIDTYLTKIDELHNNKQQIQNKISNINNLLLYDNNNININNYLLQLETCKQQMLNINNNINDMFKKLENSCFL